jgi:hypothetical protein
MNMLFVLSASLRKHIRAENARARAWVAEEPGNRWASQTIEDPAFWGKDGILTVAQYEREMLLQCFSDVYKSRLGVRPRGMNFAAMTTEEIQTELDNLPDHSADDDDDYRDEYDYDREFEFAPLPWGVDVDDDAQSLKPENTATRRVARSKGGTNTLSRNDKRAAKRNRGKARRQEGKAQVREWLLP